MAYAEAYYEEPAKLRDSGLAELFAKLAALTRSRGVAWKQETPLNNLRTFVDKVLTGDSKEELTDDPHRELLSVKTVRAELDTMGASLRQQRDQLAQTRSAVTGRVLLELNPTVEQEVLRQREQRDMQALQRACSTLIQTVVVRHVADAFAEILADTQASLNAAVRFEEFKNFPEFRDLTGEYSLSNKGKGRAVGGGAGAVTGASIGFLLGGPVGSFIGAFIGNVLGAKAGEHLADPTIVRVKLGDNAHEVIAEVIHIASEAAEQAIAKSFKQLEADFLIPIEHRLREIQAALARFEMVLKQEVRP